MRADWPFVQQCIESPHQDARNHPIDMVVLHYTGMMDAASALERLTSGDSQVSAHYLVMPDGDIMQLVSETRRAWHAGRSFWKGRTGLNHHAIGIEIVNCGHEWGYHDFPQAQIDSVMTLLEAMTERYSICHDDVIGHSDCAPDRKEDPGERFPWHELARRGLCTPTPEVSDITAPDRHIIDDLRRIGYGVAPMDPVEATPEDVIRAFQRRHRQKHVTGMADDETRRLAHLIASTQDGISGRRTTRP